MTFYTGKIDPDGVLREVFLSDGRKSNEGVIYTASQAYLIRNDNSTTLIMVDGAVQRLDKLTGRLATATFRDFSFDISALVQNQTKQKRDPRSMTTLELLQYWDELSGPEAQSTGRVTEDFHGRFAEPLFCVVAALIGFSTLLIGGYSRFGVWREVAGAFLLLVAIDGVRSTLTSTVRSDPSLWPILYLPACSGAGLVVLMLWYAARPRGAVLRRLRRSA